MNFLDQSFFHFVPGAPFIALLASLFEVLKQIVILSHVSIPRFSGNHFTPVSYVGRRGFDSEPRNQLS